MPSSYVYVDPHVGQLGYSLMSVFPCGDGWICAVNKFVAEQEVQLSGRSCCGQFEMRDKSEMWVRATFMSHFDVAFPVAPHFAILVSLAAAWFGWDIRRVSYP